MSFVFYDTETTGTDTSFDQILQFGAIKTDHELRELERFEIRCRLLPHVVPSPEALLTNGLTVEQLTDPALPSHYEMVRDIKARLEAWSPAVFIGHNSMRFDETLLRQALYQTLHDPYLTNTNGNCRLDSLPMLQAVNFFQPGILAVPVNEKGRPTFSLAQLAPLNGFAHEAAHDALGDTEATLHLCRLVYERAEGYWSNFVRFAPKASVLDFVEANDVFSFTDSFFGRTYSWMVTALGPNPGYDAEWFVFDLSNDPEAFAALADDDLNARLAASPKPVRRLRANAGPCILPCEDVPAAVRMRMPAIDELRQRAAWIRDHEGFAQRLIAAMLDDTAWEPSVHVEEQMYDGFTGPEDQAVMAAFHEAAWSDRATFLDRLDDARLKVLGERLLHTEAPAEVMPAHDRNRFEADVAKRLLAADGTVPWRTLPQALRQTDDLLTGSEGAAASLLQGLRDYLAGRIEAARAMAG